MTEGITTFTYQSLKEHDATIRNATLEELSIWAKEQRQKYDDELKRLSKFCPELRDKPLCVATNSSMCGLFEDKIDSLRTQPREQQR